MPEFLKFRLEAETLAVCERVKKANYRPCLTTLPSSSLEGMLREGLGIKNGVGIGYLRDGTYRRAYFVYSPRERCIESAKFPISMEYLEPNGSEYIIGDLYVLATDSTQGLTKLARQRVLLGGLRYKGFGVSRLTFAEAVHPEVKTGVLKGRIREDEIESFGITRVLRRVPGHLFRPTSSTGGYWASALFEGSIVTGYTFLFSEDYLYDLPD